MRLADTNGSILTHDQCPFHISNVDAHVTTTAKEIPSTVPWHSDAKNGATATETWCKLNDIGDEHERSQVCAQWRVLMKGLMKWFGLSMVEGVWRAMNDDRE